MLVETANNVPLTRSQKSEGFQKIVVSQDSLMLVSRGNSRLWDEILSDLLFLALCELVRVNLPTNAKMFASSTYGTNA